MTYSYQHVSQARSGAKNNTKHHSAICTNPSFAPEGPPKWVFISLCAICSQQVGCHGSPSFSILCHSDTVIIWHFCPFLDVIRPHCSRFPLSSSTIYPSFHQQSLYPISSYYISKILTFLKWVFSSYLNITFLRSIPPNPPSKGCFRRPRKLCCPFLLTTASPLNLYGYATELGTGWREPGRLVI